MNYQHKHKNQVNGSSQNASSGLSGHRVWQPTLLRGEHGTSHRQRHIHMHPSCRFFQRSITDHLNTLAAKVRHDTALAIPGRARLLTLDMDLSLARVVNSTIGLFLYVVVELELNSVYGRKARGDQLMARVHCGNGPM